MGSERLRSDVTGKVWKILARDGEQVDEGQVLVIFESMKMEIPLEAPRAGKVAAVLVQEGEDITEGQDVVAFEG